MQYWLVQNDSALTIASWLLAVFSAFFGGLLPRRFPKWIESGSNYAYILIFIAEAVFFTGLFHIADVATQLNVSSILLANGGSRRQGNLDGIGRETEGVQLGRDEG